MSQSPANQILQAIIIQQMRIGFLLDATNGGVSGSPVDIRKLHMYSGRLDGLIYALVAAFPNWRDLCEVSGVNEKDVNERVEAIKADIAEIQEIAGAATALRVAVKERMRNRA